MARVRDMLTQDDCYTLLTFSRRRAASAIRDHSVSQAIEAVQALCLVPVDRIDFRDLDVDFPLYAVRHTGGEVEAVSDWVIGASEPGTAGHFAARVPFARRVSLKDCGLIAVESSHGLGFMETWSNPPPRRSDLPALGIAIADFIDAGDRYDADDIHLSTLPGVWFGRLPSKEIATHGCVSVSAHLRGGSRWGHGLLIFLADVSTAEHTATLIADAARASRSGRPQCAVSSDRLLLLVVGGSFMYGEDPVETPASVRTLAEQLLARVAS